MHIPVGHALVHFPDPRHSELDHLILEITAINSDCDVSQLNYVQALSGRSPLS